MSPFSANCFTVLFSDHASCPSWLDQLWLARSGDGSLRRMIVLFWICTVVLSFILSVDAVSPIVFVRLVLSN